MWAFNLYIFGIHTCRFLHLYFLVFFKQRHNFFLSHDSVKRAHKYFVKEKNTMTFFMLFLENIIKKALFAVKQMLIVYTVAVMDNCYRSSFLPKINPQKMCLNSTAWKSIWTDGRDSHKCLVSYISSKDGLSSLFRRDQKSLMPTGALLESCIWAAGSC